MLRIRDILQEIERHAPLWLQESFDNSGVQVGDVILSIGGRPVAAVTDFDRMVGEARAQGKRTLLIHVRRANAMNFVAVPIS